MPIIPAANNLTITVDEQAWRLFSGRIDSDIPVVEAGHGGLSYEPVFASARRLSSGGYLPVSDITMVVVGWAAEDSSWHLGLIVSPIIAQARGGRWCGLARWEDQDGDQAERAGTALATTLNKPFRFVPPADHPQPTIVQAGEAPQPYAAPEAPAEAAMPEVSLMPLPIDLGEWLLQEHPQGLIFQQARGWRTKMLVYAVLSFALAAIFGALSLGARFSPYAAVQPDWLPLVGLGIALITLLIGLSQATRLARATSALIDNRQRIVRLIRRGRRTILQSPYEGLEYVLVSHIAGRREASPSAPIVSADDYDEFGRTRPRMITYDRFWPEVWIHLYSPRRGFINLCYVSVIEGRVRSGMTFRERRPLNLTEIDTPAHHAALITAQMIGLPVYVEER
jgi:hypothetical protein